MKYTLIATWAVIALMASILLWIRNTIHYMFKKEAA